MNRKIVKTALVSRVISLVAQCLFNNLIWDYDLSEEQFCPVGKTSIPEHESTNATKPTSLANQIVLFLLGGNSKWDAVYFLDIADHGYQYEQNMAFFPLLPILLHSFGKILTPLQFLCDLDNRALYILTATILNTIAFIFAALALFHLTSTVFRSQKFAYKAMFLFCYNPASVFFTSGYSESLFAMTQFLGMLILETNNHCILPVAAVLFSLGTATRSNGVVSTGFVCYKLLRMSYARNFNHGNTENKCYLDVTIMVLLNIVEMFFLATIVVLPFILFQYYGYTVFCNSTSQKSSWCNEMLPMPYSYIQNRYWNVGFLRYYELKQLPNFLLATPAIVVCVCGLYEYLTQQTLVDVLSLGFRKPLGQRGDSFVYAVHLAFLLSFGVTSMHVQVITRFIASSSPMFYWSAAMWIMPKYSKTDNHRSKNRTNMKSNLVFTYFLIYFWLGFLLHCNFYPWT